MDKVRFLQSKHPMIAKNVLAYARESLHEPTIEGLFD